ncbi:hypothetical protein Tco_1285571 [Tanacetum coccineum]
MTMSLSPQDEPLTNQSVLERTNGFAKPVKAISLPQNVPSTSNDSDDGKVLNELIECENVRMLRRERAINSFDGDDMAFQCMIRFRKFVAYFDPFLPMNIITRKAYNTIMVEGLESTGKNLVAVVRDVYVFISSFTYITDFVVLEDIGEFILINKAEVVMGKPFRKITKLEYDCAKGLMSFNRIFDNYTFQMPRTILRKFLIKNEEEIFTVPTDGVEIKPDGVASPAMLYLMRRSLEILRKFHWTILGGRSNQYREYDLAHLKLVFEFSIYKVWKSVRYGVSKDWIRRIGDFLEHGYAVSSLMDTTFLALGLHLEEIYVTWAHLENKGTRLRLYTKVMKNYAYRAWRRHRHYKAMASGSSS